MQTKLGTVFMTKSKFLNMAKLINTGYLYVSALEDQSLKYSSLSKTLIIGGLAIGLISGCAATYTKTSNHCLTYTISGDQSEEWTPIDFYQDEAENKLYMQLPKYIEYVPTIRVMDTEYDQPYKVDYKYNKVTHQLSVRDNYDQYVLTRDSFDNLSPDKVYVTCNRSMKVKKNK